MSITFASQKTENLQFKSKTNQLQSNNCEENNKINAKVYLESLFGFTSVKSVNKCENSFIVKYSNGYSEKYDDLATKHQKGDKSKKHDFSEKVISDSLCSTLGIGSLVAAIKVPKMKFGYRAGLFSLGAFILAKAINSINNTNTIEKALNKMDNSLKEE